MKKYKPFIIASVIVLILWIGNFFLFSYGERGTFGDMFGAVNSLFTGLSFAGIIYAMYLQNEELSLQRLELKETREVMQEQSNTLKLQTAESTFFRLLESHRSLISSLNFGNNKNGYEGIASLYLSIKWQIKSYKQISVTGYITDLSHTNYYPLNICNTNVENFVLVSDNIKHLIELIRRNLNDDVFYHKTFYNSLTHAEKYIIGLFEYNRKNRELISYKTNNFNYLKFYENDSLHFFDKETHNYIPKIEITKTSFSNFLLNPKQPLISSREVELFRFRFMMLENLYSSDLDIQSIILKWRCDLTKGETSTEWKFINIQDSVFQFSDLFGKSIMTHFSSIVDDLIVQHKSLWAYNFELIFNCNYSNRKIKFFYNATLNININHSNEATFEIRR